MAQLDNSESRRQPENDPALSPMSQEISRTRRDNNSFVPQGSPNLPETLDRHFDSTDRLLAQMSSGNSQNLSSNREVAQIRQDLAKHFGVDKLESLDVQKKPFDSERVERTAINNGQQGKLELMDTPDPAILLVNKEDKVFILNLQHPELDTVTNIREPGLKSQASAVLSPEKREQFQHQLLATQIALEAHAHQATESNDFKFSAKCYQSLAALYEQAFTDNKISADKFARSLGKTGYDLYNYNHDTAGLALQERALKLLEKHLGLANMSTVDERAKLIDSYLNGDNRQKEAMKLLQEQARLLPETEKEDGGLNANVVNQRINLIRQFQQVSDAGSVNKLIEHSNELIKKDGKGLPLDDQSLAAQRNFLIDYYMENNQLDKASPLLDDAAKAMAASKDFRNSARSQLIDHLVKAGKDKASELLKQERNSLEVDPNNPGVLFMLSDILAQRKELALRLTNLGEKDSALKFAKEDALLAEKLPEQPNIEPRDIVMIRMGLSGQLEDLDDIEGAAKLRNGTRDVLNTLENKKNADIINIMQARLDFADIEKDNNLIKGLLNDNLRTMNRQDIASSREKTLAIRSQMLEKFLELGMNSEAVKIINTTEADYAKAKQPGLDEAKLKQYLDVLSNAHRQFIKAGLSKDADRIFQTIQRDCNENVKINFESQLTIEYLHTLEQINERAGGSIKLSAICKERLDLAEKKYGESHSKTMPYLKELSRQYSLEHTFDSALKLQEKMFAIAEKENPGGVIGTGILKDMSYSYAQLDRMKDVDKTDQIIRTRTIAEIDQEIVHAEKQFGANSMKFADTLRFGAKRLARQNNYEQALNLQKRALSIAEQNSADKPIIIAILKDMSDSYKELGQQEERTKINMQIEQLRK